MGKTKENPVSPTFIFMFTATSGTALIMQGWSDNGSTFPLRTSSPMIRQAAV